MDENDALRTSICEFLRNTRLTCGYSQNKMAELMKMSQQSYSKLERGEGKFSLEQVLAVRSINEEDIADFCNRMGYFIQNFSDDR